MIDDAFVCILVYFLTAILRYHSVYLSLYDIFSSYARSPAFFSKINWTGKWLCSLLGDIVDDELNETRWVDRVRNQKYTINQ